ncbi:MAG TPA: efflux RND transporter periplasmic adaptor subunit [Chitinophagaceae bacterium]|nr:efflux RND transporter periplasmic adaptor subunit [Chitinophagaceae bacterium]
MKTLNQFFVAKGLTAWGILIVSSVVIYSCSSSASNPGAYQQPPQSLPVLAVTSQPVTTYQEYPASLEGSKDIEIRPQVEGYIDRIYVDEGAYVRKGQILFRINDRPYREQLNNARAGLTAARSNLVNAEINVNKLKPLVENNVISGVQLQSAQTAYNTAQANVSQAQAMVRNAEINLGYTIIKAPADGYIGRIPFKSGSLVGLTTAEALTVLSEIKEVYAYFSLSENDFLQFKNQFEGNTVEEKIKKMPPVELVLADGSLYTQKGKVQTVTGQFDNNMGTISFRAAFPNADRLLRSGSTGRVRLSKQQANVLVIPQEATFEEQDKVFVFALADSNKVIRKPIVVSGKTATYYFIGRGIQAGERIVLAGIGNLGDGMPIIPQPVSMDSLLKTKPL